MAVIESKEFAQLSNELADIARKLREAKGQEEYLELNLMLASFRKRAMAKPDIWGQFELRVKLMNEKVGKALTGSDVKFD